MLHDILESEFTWLNAGTVRPTATLYNHTDYVTCLAAAESSPLFVSGGLRGQVNLWDLNAISTSGSKVKLQCWEGNVPYDDYECSQRAPPRCCPGTVQLSGP